MKKILIAVSFCICLLFSLSMAAYASDQISGEESNEWEEGNTEAYEVTGETVMESEMAMADSDILHVYSYTSGNWTYTVSDYAATITGYSGSASSVIIPDALGGYTVTAIASSVFEGNNMTSVTIPESITSIGNRAFKNCRKLTSITINAKNLEDCSSASTYSTSGDQYSVFYNAGADSGSINVTFGSSVKKIPANLFATGADESDSVYARITNVVIPDSVETIGDNAFYDCYELKTVSWGSAIQSIGRRAFENCAITSVVIPESTTEIGHCAFKSCKKLSSVTINAKNLEDCSSASTYSNSSNEYAVFYNAGTDSTGMSVTFGNTAKRIPAYLFATGEDYSYGDGKYARVTSLTISDSVEIIGSGAFSNCYELKTVSWGSGIQSIGSRAFANCAITNVVIPESTTEIGYAAFKNCTNLSSITINAKNLEDCSYASTYGNSSDEYAVFYNAGADSDSLSVVFGDRVKRIPAYLFATGENYSYGDGLYAHITSVTISPSVEEIGNAVFYHCYDLLTVTYTGSASAWDLVEIGDDNDILEDIICTGQSDTLALRRGAAFYINYTLKGGDADLKFTYGRDTDEVLIGDWDGDGMDTICVRRGNRFYFSNTLGGQADFYIDFGRITDEVVVGDWNGDGCDTICVRRGNHYYINNTLESGNAAIDFTFGRVSDEVLSGDWDGDGYDTLCIRRGNHYYINNTLEGGNAAIDFTFGRITDSVLSGDWDGDGYDTLCIRRGNHYYINNTLEGGNAAIDFTFGREGDEVYAGTWQ